MKNNKLPKLSFTELISLRQYYINRIIEINTGHFDGNREDKKGEIEYIENCMQQVDYSIAAKYESLNPTTPDF